MPGIEFRGEIEIQCRRAHLDLPRRTFPEVGKAREDLARAVERLERLRQSGAPSQEIRTAECDWFGAEETLTLSRAAAEGRLAAAYASCLPAEAQVISVGPWTFAGWPGEVFVEYALAVKAACPDTFVISLANGELQGYIVTEAAAREGGYEAANALFGPEAGARLVAATISLAGPGR
jgi:hypothetical protein